MEVRSDASLIFSSTVRWERKDHAPTIPSGPVLFIQSMKLKNTLRHLMGEEMITHLGLEYYD